MSKCLGRSLFATTMLPQKCIFIGRLALHGRLSTCDGLIKFCVHPDLVCVLCRQDNESLNHLFSGAIWNQILVWMDVSKVVEGWHSMLQFVTLHI